MFMNMVGNHPEQTEEDVGGKYASQPLSRCKGMPLNVLCLQFTWQPCIITHESIAESELILCSTYLAVE